jgi:hypothetical protein
MWKIVRPGVPMSCRMPLGVAFSGPPKLLTATVNCLCRSCVQRKRPERSLKSPLAVPAVAWQQCQRRASQLLVPAGARRHMLLQGFAAQQRDQDTVHACLLIAFQDCFSVTRGL